MPDKPTIYRITHLWPNKQPGQGLTAQIEVDRDRRTIYVCPACGFMVSQVLVSNCPRCPRCDGEMEAVEVIPAPDRSSTVQIKPETDEPNALPSRFVSLQDYERLEREKR